MPDFKKMLFGEDVEAGKQRAANLGDAAVETLYSPLQMKALIDALPGLIRSQPKATDVPEGKPFNAVSQLAAPVIGLLTEMTQNYEQRKGALEQHYPQGVQDALGQMRELAAQDPTGAALMAMVQLFHGSPQRFNKFKHVDEVARTGQGANTYGHGIYLAENPKVAHQYASELGGKPEIMLDGKPLRELNGQFDDDEYWAAQSLLSRGDIEAVARISPEINPKVAAGFEKLKKRGKLSAQGGGQRYNVQGDFDPEDLLDWDKPLSEQSPQVREKIEKMWSEFPISENDRRFGIQPAQLPDDTTGREIHERLVSRWDQEEASRALAEYGIPGLRYLDQGSRPGVGGGPGWTVLMPNHPNYSRGGGRVNFPSRREASAYLDEMREKYGRTSGKYLEGAEVKEEATRNVVWWGSPDKLKITHINDKPVGGE